ncbi:MAG: V-type ATP synthase subunit A [Oscillospiraceae bacterium]|nr:V-type ATP synthase subunit A [Clostridiaceae bacterium]MDY5947766.1 V-type ATP synthase subunit A [Oscillospiraceae bacterium]
MSKNTIFGINGPVVTVADTKDFSMQEMVYVGNERLVGEVISIDDSLTTIQVYEVTTGLTPGEPVEGTGSAMSVTLGPGIIKNIYDGIQRPLRVLADKSGSFIERGSSAPGIDEHTLWDVTVTAKPGDKLGGGDIYATCPETESIIHKVMVPPNISGTVTFAAPDGQYTVNSKILEITDEFGRVHELTLCRKWPIRTPRPISSRLPCTVPLITGQRVIDTLMPIAKGGTAAIPGGFGTGKTMTQHQLAKWCDADIIVYVGCGERGNEMTQVLDEFGELIDPRTGRKLTDRTVLIANTSNMPVAAREASIYTGITLAEYYRDMGYAVAMMADSTSRWAEALREISGRLEEMPAEEGFPAYLPSRLAAFYERAGRVKSLNGNEGSVTVIGAVSPQGSDFSEPVTQNTKRFTRVFWALDKSLAYARHYPAINWTDSYSEYDGDLAAYYNENINPSFMEYRRSMLSLLHEESKLMEIVKLIGADVLPDDQRLVIDVARVIRVGFLQQNAYHKDDTYVPLEKQFLMMKTILHLYEKGKTLIAAGKPVSGISKSGILEKLIKMKYDIPNDKPEMFDEYISEIDSVINSLNLK